MITMEDPIIHSPKAMEVLKILRNEILTCKIPSGTHLKEMDLAKRFGVSRGSVSQAVQRLEMDNLVQTELNGRTKVVGITEKDISDMYDLRLLLEIEAIKMLNSFDYVDYSPLIQVMNAMKYENDKGKDADPISMADLGFGVHAAFFKLSNNRALFRAWKGTSGVMHQIIDINGSYVPASETYEKHKILCDSIIQKWPNNVEVIREHLLGGSKDIYFEALNNIKHQE